MTTDIYNTLISGRAMHMCLNKEERSASGELYVDIHLWPSLPLQMITDDDQPYNLGGIWICMYIQKTDALNTYSLQMNIYP